MGFSANSCSLNDIEKYKLRNTENTIFIVRPLVIIFHK